MSEDHYSDDPDRYMTTPNLHGRGQADTVQTDPSGLMEKVVTDLMPTIDFNKLTPLSVVPVDLTPYPEIVHTIMWYRSRFQKKVKEGVATGALRHYISKNIDKIMPPEPEETNCREQGPIIRADEMRDRRINVMETKAIMHLDQPDFRTFDTGAFSIEHRRPWLEVLIGIWQDYFKHVEFHYIFHRSDVPELKMFDLNSNYAESVVFSTEAKVIGLDVPMAVTTMFYCDNGNCIPPEYDPKEYGNIQRRQYEDQQILLMEDLHNDYEKSSTPRRMTLLVHNYDTAKFDIDDRLKITGFLGVERPTNIKSLKPQHYYLDGIAFQKLADVSESPPTVAELQTFHNDIRELGGEGFLRELTKSFAYHIFENHTAKLLCLICAVGSIGIKKHRSQIHGYLVGSPSSGKSEMIKEIANLRFRSVYADASSASGRGLTYAQDEFQGHKILKAGIMLRNELVCLDELDKMNAEHRSEINLVLEQQKATYTKAAGTITSNTNVCLLAAGNPKNRQWTADLAVMENLLPVQADLISRMIVCRVLPNPNPKARIRHIFDTIMDKDTVKTRYTEDQLRSLIAYARKKKPIVTEEASETIVQFLDNFVDVEQEASADLPVESRQWLEIMRAAGAIAKLLLKDKIDKECATLAIQFYTSTLESLGLTTQRPGLDGVSTVSAPNSDSVTIQKMAPDSKRVSRENLIWEIVNGLLKTADDGLIDEKTVIANMVQTGKWNTPESARRSWEQVRNFNFMQDISGKFRKIE